MKIAQMRLCQRLDRFERHIVAIGNPLYNVFYLTPFKKTLVLFRNEIWQRQKNFLLVFHSCLLDQWVPTADPQANFGPRTNFLASE